LTVVDQGRGMDAATQEQVFEPFFTTKEQGSGLGLSTVYSIVQQAGGTVTVTSTEGDGSTFSVRLPRIQ
jgi:two-component system cell cycle sensor histidine kinase/response regulator CckA